MIPGVPIALPEYDELERRRKHARCARCLVRLRLYADHAPGCAGDAGTISLSDRDRDKIALAELSR